MWGFRRTHVPVVFVLLIHILEHGYIHLTVTDDFDRTRLRVGSFDEEVSGQNVWRNGSDVGRWTG
jgi:hypothetical protein